MCGCRTAPRSQRCGTRAQTIQPKAGTPACLQKGAARATTARAHGAPVLEDYSSTCYVPSLYSLRVGISVRDVGRIPKPVPGTRPDYIPLQFYTRWARLKARFSQIAVRRLYVNGQRLTYEHKSLLYRFVAQATPSPDPELTPLHLPLTKACSTASSRRRSARPIPVGSTAR